MTTTIQFAWRITSKKMRQPYRRASIGRRRISKGTCHAQPAIPHASTQIFATIPAHSSTPEVHNMKLWRLAIQFFAVMSVVVIWSRAGAQADPVPGLLQHAFEC